MANPLPSFSFRGQSKKPPEQGPPQNVAPPNSAPLEKSYANRVDPSSADAGAQEQKSLPPQGAQFLPATKLSYSRGAIPMQVTRRPMLAELMKQAAEETQQRLVALEAQHQRKLANDDEDEDDRKEREKKEQSKEGGITTAYVDKLASALEFAATHVKIANEVGPGHGPQALAVTHTDNKGHLPGPGQQGHGTQQPPMNPGMQSSNVGPATQLQNNINDVPGGSGEQTVALTAGKTAMLRTLSKSSNAKLAGAKTSSRKSASRGRDKNAGVWDALKGAVGRFGATGRMQAADKAIKTVGQYTPQKHQDALSGIHNTLMGNANKVIAGQHAASNQAYHNNMFSKTPIKVGSLSMRRTLQKLADQDADGKPNIRAGDAVAPQTSMSGQPGGEPLGGGFGGNSALVGSNEAAINAKRNQAYSGRKSELASYFNEPALSAAHDTTLQQAFAHTSEAGTKLSSDHMAQKIAANLLKKLADEAEEDKKNNKKNGKEKDANTGPEC